MIPSQFETDELRFNKELKRNQEDYFLERIEVEKWEKKIY
jgi:hypothetical protein